MRASGLVPVLVMAVAAAFVAGCNTAGTPIGPAQQVVATGDEGLRLTVTLDRDRVTEGEAVPIHATLEYVGAGDRLIYDAPGWGPVSFGLREQYGTRDQEVSFNLDCHDHTIDKGVVEELPLIKSVGWSPDEPDASFWAAYAEDRELHLPAGTWFIDAVAWYGAGSSCDNRRNLSATVSVMVAPAPSRAR
ncbi:MAG: hypothetical protein U0869_11370 [Chloroflexota bacterium]